MSTKNLNMTVSGKILARQDEKTTYLLFLSILLIAMPRASSMMDGFLLHKKYIIKYRTVLNELRKISKIIFMKGFCDL